MRELAQHLFGELQRRRAEARRQPAEALDRARERVALPCQERLERIARERHTRGLDLAPGPEVEDREPPVGKHAHIPRVGVDMEDSSQGSADVEEHQAPDGLVEVRRLRQWGALDPLTDQHVLVCESHHRRGHGQPRMAAQRTVKPALRARFALEVELVEHASAELPQDRADVGRRKRRPDRRAQRVQKLEVLAHRGLHAGAQHLDRDGCAVERGLVNLRGWRDGHRDRVEIVQLVGRLRSPCIAQHALDSRRLERLAGS